MPFTLTKSFAAKIHYSPAVHWSPGDDFVVCTDEGVIFVTPSCKADDTDGSLKLYLDHINVPTENQTFNTGVSNQKLVEKLLEKNDDAAIEFMYDRNISPFIESSQSLKAYKTAAWSPTAPFSVRPALALLTLDCRLCIHFKSSSASQWSMVVDVSELWSQQVEATNYELLSDRVQASTEDIKDVARLRERTHVQSAVDMCFSHCLKCNGPDEPEQKRPKLSTRQKRDERCCLLITAYKSGHVIFWKMELPPTSSNPLDFINVTEVTSQGISVLHWCPVGEDIGLLSIGLQTGEVKILLVEWDAVNEQVSHKEFIVWPDQDKMVPKVFEWVEEDHILLVGKGPYFMALKLNIDTKNKLVTVSSVANTLIGPNLPVNSIHHRHNLIGVTTAGSKMCTIKLEHTNKGLQISDENIDIDLPTNTKWRCYGGQLSPNGVFMATANYPREIHCHSVYKEPLMLCYTSIMETDKVVALCLNTNSFVGMKDAFMYIQHIYTEQKTLPEKLEQLVQEKYDGLNLVRLKLVKFLLQIQVKQLKKDETEPRERLEKRIGEVQSLIMRKHAQNCLELTDGKKLTNTELTSVSLMCEWLETAESSAAHLLKKMKQKLKTLGPTETESTCVICGEKNLPFTSVEEGGCPNGHRFGRCCQTLLLCTEPGYRKCDLCNTLALHPDQLDIGEWFNEVLSNYCTKCDGTLI